MAVAAEPILQKARLIPVSGIGSVIEAEQRAASSLLAVLSAVRDLSIELLSPFGASRAQKATIESFVEVNMPKAPKRIRPDGLIRVSFGKSHWSTFVEVKTGDNLLNAEQINDYWDLARDYNVDHVLTISNEITPQEGMHPTEGLKVRSNSRVGVSHLSWTAIVTAAIRIKRHKGVSDTEQAWLLDELIRYLQHPKSGALDFTDMGSKWVGVRDGARQGTLSKRSEGIDDVVARWDQLMRFVGLQLSAEIGDDVEPMYPRGQVDPQRRLAALIDSLCGRGELSGALRIPNTAGDLLVDADLRARQITASMEVNAPQDRGARGRVSWLATQIADARGDVVIEAFVKNARSGTFATLGQTLEDRLAPLGAEKGEPHRFRLAMRSEMGMGRATGAKSPGFITSVLNLINSFYGDVVQVITPWQPPAPQLSKPQPSTEAEKESEREPDTRPEWPWY